MGKRLADGLLPWKMYSHARHEQEEAVDHELRAIWSHTWEGAAQQVPLHHHQPGLEVEYARQQNHDEGEQITWIRKKEHARLHTTFESCCIQRYCPTSVWICSTRLGPVYNLTSYICWEGLAESSTHRQQQLQRLYSWSCNRHITRSRLGQLDHQDEPRAGLPWCFKIVHGDRSTRGTNKFREIVASKEAYRQSFYPTHCREVEQAPSRHHSSVISRGIQGYAG